MNRLQLVACRVLAALGTYELKMCSYYDTGKGNNNCERNHIASINVCDTSFCIAGHLAHEDGYPEQFFYKSPYNKEVFDYGAYSKELIGDRYLAWDFFFSSNWSDDIELARKRMEFVVKEGYIPRTFDGCITDFEADDIEWE